MEITHVTITIHVKPIPKSNLIVVRNVITGGSGDLEEVIQGGQVKYSLKLTKGHEVRPLEKGESVFVSGTNADGDQITLPFALKTGATHRPWSFAGESGSTG
jgi:hypothetical protein